MVSTPKRYDDAVTTLQDDDQIFYHVPCFGFDSVDVAEHRVDGPVEAVELARRELYDRGIRHGDFARSVTDLPTEDGEASHYRVGLTARGAATVKACNADAAAEAAHESFDTGTFGGFRVHCARPVSATCWARLAGELQFRVFGDALSRSVVEAYVDDHVAPAFDGRTAGSDYERVARLYHSPDGEILGHTMLRG